MQQQSEERFAEMHFELKIPVDFDQLTKPMGNAALMYTLASPVHPKIRIDMLVASRILYFGIVMSRPYWNTRLPMEEIHFELKDSTKHMPSYIAGSKNSIQI